MRVALGAWGIGALAAAHSDTWAFRFGRPAGRIDTLPPMSAVHPGLIEPFPLLLCEKVFIDAAQYDKLTDRRFRARPAYGEFMMNPVMKDLLPEFERAGILEVADYSALVAPHLDEIAHGVEAVLEDTNLSRVAAASRELWLRFLLSPGGAFLHGRERELRAVLGRTNPDTYEGEIPLAALGIKRLPDGRKHLPIAGIVCGHDVFDAMTLLTIGKLLDAMVSDWQMYGPIYRQCIMQRSDFRAVRSAASLGGEPTEWYIPIPQTVYIDDIWRLRENPYMRFLRDEAHRVSASRLAHFENAGDILELRRVVHERIKGTVLNTYRSYGASDDESVFVEHLPPGAREPGSTNTRDTGVPQRAGSPGPPNPGRAGSAHSVFISYAHDDNESVDRRERWLDRLLQHVKPFVSQGEIRVFSDLALSPGEAWDERIRSEIEEADVAVLLVSSAYLASDFIRNSELPAILRRAQSTGMPIMSVIVNPCLFAESFFLYPDPALGPQSISLSVFQAANDPSKPLSSLPPSGQEEALRRIALGIRDVLGRSR